MKIYLASESPRRTRLLGWTGLEFEAVKHKFDEKSLSNDLVKDLVGEISLQKAYSVMEGFKEGDLVIGSDLMIDLDGNQLGKPKDKDEARETLMGLSGKTHSVWSGIAVVKVGIGEGMMSVCETRVKMKDYDEEIVSRYLKEFKVLDKGGGYSILYELKGYGSLVEKIEDSMTNVLGFPLHYLENLLKEFKVKPKKDWRKICKKETGYEY